MRIRPINRDDIDRVIRIEQESFSPWTPAQLVAEMRYPASFICIAEDRHSQIVGWYSVRAVTDEAELLKIAVSRQMRRKGVGRMLITNLLNVLVEKKIATIFLEVRSRNTAALHFYEKNGFLQVGERPGYYSSPTDNALIFRKDLPYIES